MEEGEKLALYEQAIELASGIPTDEELENAIDMLTSLGDYLDSKERAEELRIDLERRTAMTEEKISDESILEEEAKERELQAKREERERRAAEAKAKLEQAKDAVKEKLGNAKDAVIEKLGNAKDAVGDFFSDVKDKVGSGAIGDTLSEFRENAELFHNKVVTWIGFGVYALSFVLLLVLSNAMSDPMNFFDKVSAGAITGISVIYAIVAFVFGILWYVCNGARGGVMGTSQIVLAILIVVLMGIATANAQDNGYASAEPETVQTLQIDYVVETIEWEEA